MVTNSPCVGASTVSQIETEGPLASSPAAQLRGLRLLSGREIFDVA